jgi:chromosome segregation ATPase
MTDYQLEKHLKLLHMMQSGKAVFAFEDSRLVASVIVDGCTEDIDIKNEIEEIEAEIPPREYDLFKNLDMWNSYGRSLRKKRGQYTDLEKERSETFKISTHEAQERLRLLKQYQEFLQRKLKEYRTKQLRGMDLHSTQSEKQNPDATRKSKIEKCKEVCQRLNLPERQTVSREIKFIIAETIGMKGLGSFTNFKSGKSKAYQSICKMLSELGYSKK